MRFSEAWLRDWIDPPIATAALAEQLTMAGLEVEAIDAVAPAFSGVVVGDVVSVAAHPDAAKLHLCQVAVGDGAPLPIVCGAANVAAGMKVALARVGAVLPGDVKIKKAKLRGVESHGMICSATELGLAESSSGILPLPDNATVGADVRAVLGLDDQAIELNLTPDRSDCLSIAGVAREVAVINGLTLTPPPIYAAVSPEHDRSWAVKLHAPAACPRYACRLIENLNPDAVTPLWLRERLRRSGLRAISPLVDVTNYVLLELGQPLHAFDAAKLAGAIQVRFARADEPLTLLNEQTVTLRPDTLVIADDSGAIALAGIMGGLTTAVTATTTSVLLESAFFAPAAIAGRARSYGLHTDASHRFERGVDAQLQMTALERATALLLSIAGGAPGPVVEVHSPTDLPVPPTITLRQQRIGQVLGVTLDAVTVVDILTRLGLTLTASVEIPPAPLLQRGEIGGGEFSWQVTVPSFRPDLQREVDVIAELGRIYGYNRIPVQRGRSATVTRATPEAAFDLNVARARLVTRGYHEVITYSFVNPTAQRALFPDQPVLALSNPISAELAEMRTSLWPGLMQAAQQNLTRQQGRVRIFETGLRFRLDSAGELQQEAMLAGLVTGSVLPEQWGVTAQAVDFYDAKSDVEAVLALTGAGWAADVDWQVADHAALHPGQSAQILRNGQLVGWLGMVHPRLAAQLELPPALYLFELALAALGDGRKPHFAPLSKYPSVRRDLAIVVDAGVAYADIVTSIRAAAGDWLRQLVIFDRYSGESIESTRKSLALGLILQSFSKTLADEESDALIARVLERLAHDVGAQVRG
ncbi:phenylalanine--tRNA ligase subunit beta [Thiospirillum jenense]|uniref:Phenylalanine--tRNA ligase beta subunit n=1 Tax=Thiospirillum jenense TaxID=1653858 RepID=A0A839H995_9GAMM|nr:phenylalanine--tRNA ligase subunit beta [Thiospirillum jenense]MBB1125893.1 phenylalanine--tRNA ligase subunit beta [Thiospirillum jenense]